MTNVVAALLMIGSLAAPQAIPDTVKPFLGEWVSTVVAPPGEGPMIAPKMSVTALEGGVGLALGTGAPVKATTFATMDNRMIITARIAGTRGASQFIILKLTSAGRMQVEYFVEIPAGGRGQDFYVSEVFARASK